MTELHVFEVESAKSIMRKIEFLSKITLLIIKKRSGGKDETTYLKYVITY